MCTGVLTGIFGVGGGFLIVPALLIITRMPIRKAITTSLLIIFLTSIVGFSSHIFHQEINLIIVLSFSLTGFLGMYLAVKIKHKLNDKQVQKIFAVMLIILGLVMIFKQFIFT